MRDYCKHCAYLDTKNYNKITGKYYCKQKGWYVVFDSGACSSFLFDPAKRNLHLTTKAFEMLNIPLSNDKYLDIRELRDCLEENEEYSYLLMIYDMVGPVLAARLEEDELGLENAAIMVEQFIKPCVLEFRQGNIEQAFDIYEKMVSELMEIYNVNLLNVKEDEHYSLEANNTCVRDFDAEGLDCEQEFLLKRSFDPKKWLK